MKVAIYSAVFGDYDPDPYDVTKHHRDKVDFWWITDKNMKDKNGWMVQIDPFVDDSFSDKFKFAKMNRLYKLQPHKIDILEDSDINVYIDGNKKLFNMDLLLYYCTVLHNNPDNDAFFFRHVQRDTVQQEVREIARLRRDEPSKVMKQYKGYREEGFPDNIPLIVASVQIRKTHSEQLQTMLDCWWNEVSSKSYRDQISLPYSIWKTGFNRYKILDVKQERLKMISNSNHKKVLRV